MIMIRVLATRKDFNLLTYVFFWNRLLLERSWITGILSKYAHTQDGMPHGTQGQGSMYSWVSHNPPGKQAVLSACLMLSSAHSDLLPLGFSKSMATPRLQSQAWHRSSKVIQPRISVGVPMFLPTTPPQKKKRERKEKKKDKRLSEWIKKHNLTKCCL